MQDQLAISAVKSAVLSLALAACVLQSSTQDLWVTTL